MHPTLRRILIALVLLCGTFMTSWLSFAAAQAPEPPAEALALGQASPSPEPTAGGPVPGLVADQAEHDFGTVLSGQKATHVFTLTNSGPQAVQILEVRSSCGCTTAVLSARTVEPGGKAELRAVFSAGGARGRFRKTVKVRTDAPGPPLKLAVYGKVLPRFRVEPELLLFGRVAPGQTRSGTVRLTAARPEAGFRPGEVRTQGLAVEVRSPRPVPGQPGAWTLEVVARPRSAGDRLDGVVLVGTGDGEAPFATVRVSGDVR